MTKTDVMGSVCPSLRNGESEGGCARGVGDCAGEMDTGVGGGAIDMQRLVMILVLD